MTIYLFWDSYLISLALQTEGIGKLRKGLGIVNQISVTTYKKVWNGQAVTPKGSVCCI